MPNLVNIYGLCDKKTGKTFYIGKTGGPMYYRVNHHWYNRNGKMAVCKRVRNIGRKRLEIFLIGTYAGNGLFWETNWVQQFNEWGFKLCNRYLTKRQIEAA